MSHVIAVAGPIGGGKTSLVKALAGILPDASLLFYDNYESASQGSLDAMIRWMRDGADIDSLDIGRLAADLARLKAGQAVTDPVTKQEVRPGKFIILEMPLGREHKLAAPHIDLLIWIDTPLEIALARKMREITGFFLTGNPQADGRDFVAWLHRYLDDYLRAVRDLLTLQRERVSVHADIVLDGRDAFDEMVAQAVRLIALKLP
jgi:energy-coupling factor transporter ATP-binding protein EcfA2